MCTSDSNFLFRLIFGVLALWLLSLSLVLDHFYTNPNDPLSGNDYQLHVVHITVVLL